MNTKKKKKLRLTVWKAKRRCRSYLWHYNSILFFLFQYRNSTGWRVFAYSVQCTIEIPAKSAIAMHAAHICWPVFSPPNFIILPSGHFNSNTVPKITTQVSIFPCVLCNTHSKENKIGSWARIANYFYMLGEPRQEPWFRACGAISGIAVALTSALLL